MFKTQLHLKSLTLENNNAEIKSFKHLPKSCKNLRIKKNTVHLVDFDEFSYFDSVAVNDCAIPRMENVFSALIDFSFCDLSQVNLDMLKTDKLILQHCNLQRFPKLQRVPSYIDISSNQLTTLKYLNKDARTLICKNNHIKSLRPLKGLQITRLDLEGNQVLSLRWLSSVNSMVSINLSGNPISDSAQLGFLQENLQLQGLTFKNTPMSEQPLFTQRRDQLVRYLKYRKSSQARK